MLLVQGSGTVLDLDGAKFESNKAINGLGGGISKEGDMCHIKLVGRIMFIDNTADFGGAIGTTCNHASALIEGALFYGNSASKSGGGVHATVSYNS